MALALLTSAMLVACRSPSTGHDAGLPDDAGSELAVETWDLNTTAPDDFEQVRLVTTVGARVFGVVTTTELDEALFVTDGTEAGTRVLPISAWGVVNFSSDLEAGPDGIAYFLANDGNWGSEVWRSDGTPAGTWRVTDGAPGPDSSFQVWVDGHHPFAVLDAGVVFSSAHEQQSVVYVADRATGLTRSLMQFEAASGGASNFHRVGDRVFFVGGTSALGRELYVTDGTPEGTRLVADVNAGPADGFGHVIYEPSTVDFAEVGGRLYFGASGVLLVDGGAQPTGPELHALDLDAGTVRLVKDIQAGPSGSGNAPDLPPRLLTPVADRLFFVAGIPVVSSEELWVSDGTASGTQALTSLNSWLPYPLYYGGSAPSPFYGEPRPLAVGTRLFFEPPAGLTAPWVSDGTVAGTGPIPAADQCPGGLDPNSLRSSFLGAVGSKVVYLGTERRLCASDGINPAQVLEQVSTVDQLPAAFANAGPYLIVAGGKLTRTDGTPAGTQRVGHLSSRVASSRPGNLTSVGTSLFFFATDAVGSRAFEVADGGSPTALDFPPDGSSNWSRMASLDGGLVVSTGDGTLLRLDQGSLTTLHAGPGAHPMGAFQVVGGLLFYELCGYQAASGLWASDGTPAGTRLVAGFDGNLGCPLNREVQSDGQGVFFVWRDAVGARTIRWWNGGPPEVVSAALAGGSYPTLLASGNGVVWFEQSGELWRLKRLGPGQFETRRVAGAPAEPSDQRYWNGELYFAAGGRPGDDAGVFGKELYRTVGQADAVLVKDIFPGTPGSGVAGFAPCGTALCFSAVDPVGGRELWATSGTPESTARVADLFPGQGSGFQGLIATLESENVAVFAGSTPATGTELWKTDGTANGTRRLTDLAPGSASSNPWQFVRQGPWLYFVATDEAAGTELRRMRIADLLDGGSSL